MIDTSPGDPLESYVFPVLREGMRVRLHSPEWGLSLQTDVGTVVRPTNDDGYYVIRLDLPATYDHGTGQPEQVLEVVEASDNVDILGR